MKLSDLKSTYVKFVERMYTKVFKKDIDERHKDNLGWVKKNIGVINNILSSMTNDNTRKQYSSAINYVISQGVREKKPEQDRTYYKKQYVESRSADDEWIIFQRALSYLVKANMPAERCGAKNCVRNPTQKTIDKYGLYQNKDIWYSTLVDAYCQTHKNCRKN